MGAVRIKSVTNKKTGRKLDVIRPQQGDAEQRDILLHALAKVNSRSVVAVGVFFKEKEADGRFTYRTDFSGVYDDLSAGAGLLKNKIDKIWIDNYSHD